MNLETLRAIAELDERVHAATSQFCNSAVAAVTHDPALGHVFGDVPLSASDILLVAALSQTHALVTGPTGCGKTEMAGLVCQGLFGGDGWFLLRLNPHLTEETFADISLNTLADRGLREAISPAPFLSLPCTVLDECNRTPAALTNILLGFADGRIELKCGVKYDVGHAYRNASGLDQRYHLVIGTMNEGNGYEGTFALDSALSRRFTLRIPFTELRPTSSDLIRILEQRTGHAEPIGHNNAVGRIAALHATIKQVPLDPLAFVFLAYLGNMGRCPYAETGFHPQDPAQQLCARSECRIQKRSNGFCPSTGGLNAGMLIFLKRAACGLAALRAARTVRAIEDASEPGSGPALDQLREFSGVALSGDALRAAALAKYVQGVSLCAEDVKVLLPFVALGGKVWTASEYVAKNFSGSTWQALRHYGRETFGSMENFFRQQRELFDQLAQGNGAVDKLKRRLEHAERFTDPAIRHCLEPFLENYPVPSRRPAEVAEEIQRVRPVRDAAADLLCS